MSALYTEVHGQGPDLVLLHGWGLNLRVWDRLARALSDRFRVIAIDLPGHGRSEWNAGACTPAEQAWLIHQTLASMTERYALLGWSLGGQIALDLAAATPAQVERLALVATTPKFAAGPDWPHGMAPTLLEKLATQLRTDYKRTVSEFLELQVRGSIGSKAVLEELRTALFAHGEARPEALAAGLGTLATTDLRQSLALVGTPALVLAGQYDRVTPPSASRALSEALPNARYAEFKRAAHAPFLSHPKEFAKVLKGFLATPPSAEGETTAQDEATSQGATRGESTTAKPPAKTTTGS
jgi:pimeloyl-[acyl-carrier protein] methyl ester esterase